MTKLKDAIQRKLFEEMKFRTDYKPYIDLLDYMNDKLLEMGITGNVAEIGVATGAFFIPLALCCREGELAIAIDVFEELQSNWNVRGGTSAIGNIQNLAKMGGIETIVRFIGGDSLHVLPSEILAAGDNVKTKLFSVDGSHSVYHTVSDLQLAGSVVAPGGVVLLDDVKNWGWPGSIEGFARYSLLQPQPRLVPFLLFQNKFLMTTASHQKRWLDASIAYAKSLGRLPEATYRISRFFGWDVIGW